MTTMKTTREIAAKYLAAKSAKGRKAARDYVAERAENSKRQRWANMLAAMDASDTARIAAYAASGDARKAAWKAVREADAQPEAAKPAAKPSKPAKAKPAAKASVVGPRVEAQFDPSAVAAALAAMPAAEQVAFLNGLTKAIAGK